MAIDPHLKQSNNRPNNVSNIWNDIIFDNNMNPYLLEFNKRVYEQDKLDEFMKTDVQYDMFSLVNLIPRHYPKIHSLKYMK